VNEEEEFEEDEDDEENKAAEKDLVKASECEDDEIEHNLSVVSNNGEKDFQENFLENSFVTTSAEASNS
jgi:hypothetical protein